MKDWVVKSFNFGNVLILISWLVSSVWFASKLNTTVDSLRSDMVKIVETMDKRISSVENRVISIESYYHDLNIKGSTTLQTHLLENQKNDNLVSARITSLEQGMTKIAISQEQTLGKVSVIQNDISWIKTSLLDQKDFKGAMNEFKSSKQSDNP
jgi:hypothetical protein